MVFKTLSRQESQRALDEWKNNNKEIKVEKEYMEIRNKLVEINRAVTSEFTKEYDIDLNFGIKLYGLLKQTQGFSIRLAANDDFWRYLSVKVVPDIVAQRWGDDNFSHFYDRATRIWLRSMWWYVHLSWQGDESTTLEVLKNNTTDEILNLVERAGYNGYYLKVYRNIMYFYSKVPVERKYIKTDTNNSVRFFRKIMILHTARSTVMEPSLCIGGEREYVRNIFRDLGELV